MLSSLGFLGCLCNDNPINASPGVHAGTSGLAVAGPARLGDLEKAAGELVFGCTACGLRCSERMSVVKKVAAKMVTAVRGLVAVSLIALAMGVIAPVSMGTALVAVVAAVMLAWNGGHRTALDN